ncbi:MAG: hypothetical protein AAF614_42495 [Chloroflexota bacterium]
MKSPMTAVELTGIIDENQQLRLDSPLPIIGPAKVKVLLLYTPDEEIDEATWLSAAARNPAFQYLKDAEEDIYTLSDGKPFDDKV